MSNEEKTPDKVIAVRYRLSKKQIDFRKNKMPGWKDGIIMTM